MKARIFLLVICLLFLMAPMAHGVDLKLGVIKGNDVNLRVEPALGGRIISVLKQGLSIAIMEETEFWVKVQLPDGQTGWVYRQFVELKPLTSITSRGHFTSFSVGDMIVYAKNLLGVNYVYGGQSTKGFDCSGFTMHVFAKFGIRLPHQADLQMGTGTEILTKEGLLPGDLVFFKTRGSRIVNHVGIYLGNNQFIHASSGSGAVRVSPLDSGYYYNCYVGGRRLNNDNVRDEQTVN